MHCLSVLQLQSLQAQVNRRRRADNLQPLMLSDVSLCVNEIADISGLPYEGVLDTFARIIDGTKAKVINEAFNLDSLERAKAFSDKEQIK